MLRHKSGGNGWVQGFQYKSVLYKRNKTFSSYLADDEQHRKYCWQISSGEINWKLIFPLERYTFVAPWGPPSTPGAVYNTSLREASRLYKSFFFSIHLIW